MAAPKKPEEAAARPAQPSEGSILPLSLGAHNSALRAEIEVLRGVIDALLPFAPGREQRSSWRSPKCCRPSRCPRTSSRGRAMRCASSSPSAADPRSTTTRSCSCSGVLARLLRGARRPSLHRPAGARRSGDRALADGTAPEYESLEGRETAHLSDRRRGQAAAQADPRDGQGRSGRAPPKKQRQIIGVLIFCLSRPLTWAHESQ